MRVLIVGGGGREHAMAWSVAREAAVARVFCAPGNAGTALEPKVCNRPVAADDIPGLLALAQAEGCGLTLVGPEAPLAAGIVDAFAAAGLACFGPTQRAAELESSKAFAKEFLRRHGIPTAPFASFTDEALALAHIDAHIAAQGLPIVVKADGLAAGKGVVVARSREEARAAASAMLQGGLCGAAGRRIVVEAFVPGEEASFICVTDGEHAVPLASAQDHKARDDGDLGPNTGGMGAYSPAPVVTEAVCAEVMARIVGPTLAGMAAEGRPYRGFLYVGLIFDDEGRPLVLEFNCRLGDPEAQVILLRLQSGLLGLCQAALAGGLAGLPVAWAPEVGIGVVLAAAGYPGPVAKGEVIAGLDGRTPPGVKVFHAATARREDGAIVTQGGRVLTVCALGEGLPAARQAAYAACAGIHWSGAFYRRDIGHRALPGAACGGRP